MPRVFILHVSADNKGTLAILKSEISELKKICENVEITVSALYAEDLKRMEPKLSVVPPLIDSPTARADSDARQGNYERVTRKYKFRVLIYSFLVFLQVFLSIVSIVLVKAHLKPIYRPDVLEQFEKADLVVCSDDESFKEGSVYIPYLTYLRRKPILLIYHTVWWWFFLIPKMWNIIIAKKIFKKPVVVFPNSVGPFRTSLGRFMAKIIFNNVDSLLLRDSYSIRFLKNLKINKPFSVTVDIALLFEVDPKKFNKPLPKPIVGVCPGLFDFSFSSSSRREYVSAHSKVLDDLVKQYGFSVSFLPSNVCGLKHDDLELCKIIMQDMVLKHRARIINTRNAEEFKYYLDQLDLLIATRMHPSILACTHNVPFIPIIYDHKQIGFLEHLGLENIALEIDDVSYERLQSRVKFVWDNRERIKKQLASRTPTLQENVRANITKTVSKFISA